MLNILKQIKNKSTDKSFENINKLHFQLICTKIRVIFTKLINFFKIESHTYKIISFFQNCKSHLCELLSIIYKMNNYF